MHNLWLSNALLKAGNHFFFFFSHVFSYFAHELLSYNTSWYLAFLPHWLICVCCSKHVVGTWGQHWWRLAGKGDVTTVLHCPSKVSKGTQANLLLHSPDKLTLAQQWMLSRCGRVSEMENTPRHHPCRLGCAVLSPHCSLERSGISAMRNGPLTHLTPQPEFLKAFLPSCNLRKSCMCPWLRSELSRMSGADGVWRTLLAWESESSSLSSRHDPWLRHVHHQV